MSLTNCSQCGKLCLSNALKMCPDCQAEYEKQVDIVMEYMREVPRATIAQISEVTGIKEKVIYDLVKRGALVGSNCTVSYPCENCGKLIDVGRLCHDCTIQVQKNLGIINDKDFKAPDTKFSQKSNSKWYMN